MGLAELVKIFKYIEGINSSWCAEILELISRTQFPEIKMKRSALLSLENERDFFLIQYFTGGWDRVTTLHNSFVVGEGYSSSRAIYLDNLKHLLILVNIDNEGSTVRKEREVPPL